MNFYDYLNEYSIKYGYAGRDVVGDIVPGAPSSIIWMYITDPKLGLIWSDVKGNVYKYDKKIAKIEDYGAHITHKNLMAAAYNKLGLVGDLRKDVDTITDNDLNPRGRIIMDKIYIYTGFDKKLNDKAIKAIYDYVPED